MFNLLPVLIILVACTTPLVMREFTGLPSQLNYLTDMVIAGASVLIVARLVIRSSWSVIPLGYILTFVGFAYVVVSGLIINTVEPITVIAGVRTYFKYVPIFLLPFAMTAAGIDLRAQLKFLLALTLVQLPLALFQRFLSDEAAIDSIGSGGITGDLVRGSLTSSSTIAVVCAAAIIMVAAFYIRKHISLTTAIVLGLLLMIPTAVAETKTTPIFLGLGGGGLMLLLWRQLSAKMVGSLVTAGFVLLIGFLISYDQLYSKNSAGGYLSLMTSSEYTLDSYNLQGARAKSFSAFRDQPDLVAAPIESTETDVDVGRLDSLKMPFDVLWPEETVRLMVGLGIGNVDSTLGPGAHYRQIKRDLAAGATTLTLLLWETGILGAALFCVFTLLITRDSMRLAKEEGIVGAFGAGMFGISLVFLLCLIYTNSLHSPEVMILFIYLGGLVSYLTVNARQKVDRSYPAMSPISSPASLSG